MVQTKTNTDFAFCPISCLYVYTSLFHYISYLLNYIVYFIFAIVIVIFFIFCTLAAVAQKFPHLWDIKGLLILILNAQTGVYRLSECK